MRLLGRIGKMMSRPVSANAPTRLGRAPENEVQVQVDGVSRLHARLVPDGDAFWIEDLNSSNGTFLNGQRITRERVSHLDVITLGVRADLIVDARRSGASTAVASATTKVTLELVDEKDHGTTDVAEGEMTIGRLAPATLVIDSPVISKAHARIRRTGDQIVIEDLHSSNGTFVNGATVKQPTPLRDEDLISIGGVRAYRVRFAPMAETPVLDPTIRMDSRKDLVPPPAFAVEAVPAEPVAEAFAQDWKTKFAWSPEDLAILEAERAKVIEEVKRVAGLLPDADGTDRPAPTPPATLGPVAASASAPGAPTVPLSRPAGAPAPAPAGPITSFGHASPVTSIPLGLMDDAQPERPKPEPGTKNEGPKAAEQPTPRAVVTAPRVAAPEAPTEAYGKEQLDVPHFVPETISVRAAVLKGKAGEFVLHIGTHVIGRQEDAQIHINDRQISRRHASISVSAAAVTVDDLGSANGTKVNGEPVTRRRDLANGDTLSLGEVEFKVELP